MDAAWKIAVLALAVAQTVLLIVFVVKPFHNSNNPGIPPEGRSILAPTGSGLFSKP